MATQARSILVHGLTAGALALGVAGCGSSPLVPDRPKELARAPTVAIQLIAFNDFHGQLEPPIGKAGEIATDAGPVPAGGIEYLATWVAELSKANPNTVVVAAGDNIGATPLVSAAFHDEPTIEGLGEVGLMLTSVGNHEFDEGIVELQRMQKGGCHPSGCFGGDGFAGAKFQFLAANVVRDDDGTTLFPPYAIREFDGVKVAFIGMTLEGTPQVVTAKGVEGVRFKDEVETVNALVPELTAQGIHAIVVLLHEGGLPKGGYDACVGVSGPIVAIAEAMSPEVDAIVSGHTHAAYNCEFGGKLVTSAAHYGRLVTRIELEVDRASGDVVTKRAKNLIVTRDVAKAPALTALVERYGALVKDYAEAVVATLPKDLVRSHDAGGQSPLGMLIADAQLAAEADASTGRAEVALMNPGGIRSDILAGEVTFAELFAVQPFGNNLVTMTLSGAELLATLEEQFAAKTPDGMKAREEPKFLQVSATLTYAWDPKKPAGARIDPKSVKVGKKPLDLRRDYRVVMNYFLAGGGDGFTLLAAGRDRTIGIIDLDALVAYLKAHPGQAPPASGRVTRR